MIEKVKQLSDLFGENNIVNIKVLTEIKPHGVYLSRSVSSHVAELRRDPAPLLRQTTLQLKGRSGEEAHGKVEPVGPHLQLKVLVEALRQGGGEQSGKGNGFEVIN